MSDRIRKLLDNRYGLRRKTLHAVVTSAPMVDGRSVGYVVATVAGVPGVHVNVSPDLRAPISVNDGILVEGIGTPVATSYWVVGRTAGDRANSDVYVFPAGGTSGSTTYEAGDILLGSTLDGWSNWWYQFANGRWIIRQGTVMHGAIGNLEDLYDYGSTEYGTVFGEYSASKIFIAMDPTNGFRIMLYDTRMYQADVDGTTYFGKEGEAEIVVNPDDQQIEFWISGSLVSYINATGELTVDRNREFGAVAEFPGAVLAASSGSNTGTMTGAYDGTNYRNYYNWTTSESTAQDYDILWQFRLPPEFSDWNSASSVYVTSRVSPSTAGSNTNIQLVEFLQGNGVNRITASSKSSSAWTEDAYQIATGCWSGGDVVTAHLRLTACPGCHAQLHSVRIPWLTTGA